MNIYVRAKPKSRKVFIRKIDTIHYIVAVSEPAISGQANRAILKSLAKYFGIPYSQMHIVHGEKSKQKVLAIPLSIEEIEASESQKKLF